MSFNFEIKKKKVLIFLTNIRLSLDSDVVSALRLMEQDCPRYEGLVNEVQWYGSTRPQPRH